MVSSKGKLSPLQNDFLEAWFGKTTDFFLTGGAVLVGFLGAPRITRDLDLFTTKQEAFEDAACFFDSICRDIEAHSQVTRTARYFRRYIIERQGEETIVDLFLDPAPQIYVEKEETESGIFIDRAEEILTNKICSIVGRSEARDYFDVYYLWKLGHNVDRALELAHTKDGGVDEEALLFVLSSISWDFFTLPGCDEVMMEEIRAFFGKWAESISLRLFPKK
ncbi:MAG: nucleotidyl transferase AbiEii/AbiGii toxin family protein [Vulcanimicrobiota bacterium]